MSGAVANPAPWKQTEAALAGIFERRWYTNHGPAAQMLERRLGSLLDVPEVVVAANPAIALLMALEALGLSGQVVLPGVAPPRCVQALRFAGLEAAFCDVDPLTGGMTAATAAVALTPRTAAILGVNQWGGACDIAGLRALAAERGIPLVHDSGGSFGCHAGHVPLGRNGRAEMFAFDEGSIVDGAGGACVATDDPALAARLRNIRSSYGAGPPVPVTRTANGRLSEAQAVFAMLGLDNYPANQAHGAALHQRYAAGLAGLDAVAVLAPGGVTTSNHQATLCRVAAGGDAMDRMLAVLEDYAIAARRIQAPGAANLPGAAWFAAHTFTLPMGNAVTDEMAGHICAVIRAAACEA